MDARYAIRDPRSAFRRRRRRRCWRSSTKTVAQALHTNEVQEKLSSLGMEEVASWATDASRYIENERQKWSKAMFLTARPTTPHAARPLA
jgi:hypothetical protein